MENLDTLSSLNGRNLIFEIYYELRYNKQMSGFRVLTSMWKLCTHERDMVRYINKEITVVHPLGTVRGTMLWMEEVVNRFYFSTINSFVYFGAAILLVLIGVRRFSENISDSFVIAGVAFEALMLIFMFLVMLFTPNDDPSSKNKNNSESANEVDDLVYEIGEISRDFAAVVVQLENLSSAVENLVDKQTEMLNSVNDLAQSVSQAVSPNPAMLESMNLTNTALNSFKETVELLNKSAESLKREEIELAVRKEVERILIDKITK
jgi:methyl-accepting chemotaxis protein